MKSTLKITITMFLCLLLFGCACSKKDNNEIETKSKVEENISEKLFTDNSKIVFNNDAYKLVFYFDNTNQITGCEHYYEYKNEKEAEENYISAINKLKNDASIEKIERKDNFVIYTIASSKYIGKTVSEIKELYSFLIPVYKD